MGRVPAAVLALLGACACRGALAVPVEAGLTGRRTAELCVQTSAAGPSCGPAQLDLRANGAGTLRVDDVVYHFQLNSSQIDIVVMHNVVQIDEFTVPYEWADRSLRFRDDERHTLYEIRIPSGTSGR